VSRTNRREVILDAAAELFSERGYPATGIDEIGEAAGISGPGVYRHFETKSRVLGEVVERAVSRVMSGVADVVGGSDEPWGVLRGLTENMIRSVLADRAAWTVVVGEQRHLEPDAARALSRGHRLHVEEWVHALVQVRPDLDDADVRVVVHGVLGVTAPFAVRTDRGLTEDRVVTLLTDVAMRIMRDTKPAPRAPRTRGRSRSSG
jgi:AcrR family transcriptional regulator